MTIRTIQDIQAELGAAFTNEFKTWLDKVYPELTIDVINRRDEDYGSLIQWSVAVAYIASNPLKSPIVFKFNNQDHKADVNSILQDFVNNRKAEHENAEAKDVDANRVAAILAR